MFRFEYDQWYLARNGQYVRIVIAIGEMVHGSNSFWYLNNSNGKLYDEMESDWDLIEYLPLGKPRSNGAYQLGEAHAQKYPQIHNLADNPFKRGTSERDQWRSGFLAGIVAAASRS